MDVQQVSLFWGFGGGSNSLVGMFSGPDRKREAYTHNRHEKSDTNNNDTNSSHRSPPYYTNTNAKKMRPTKDVVVRGGPRLVLQLLQPPACGRVMI